MYHIANPIFLYLLVAAVIIAAVYAYTEYRRAQQMKQMGKMPLLKLMMPAQSVARQRVKFILAWLALVAVIMVAARLQFAYGQDGMGQKLNVEVVATVDISNSMLCEDEQPSRLDKAKQILSTFIDNCDNAKMAIVEFAGTAVTKMPRTQDYHSARMFINSMEPSDISIQGTAVGAALLQAQRCFSKEGDAARVVVLITDAENHEDDAVGTAKKIAKESGAKIIVIGLGSAEGAPIVIDGNVLKDQGGQPVVTKLDEETAKAIAEAGNGKYIHSVSPLDIAETLNSQIKSMANGTAQSKAFVSYSDQFETFAWIAFVLLLVDLLVMERKNSFFERINIFRRSPAAAKGSGDGGDEEEATEKA